MRPFTFATQGSLNCLKREFEAILTQFDIRNCSCSEYNPWMEITCHQYTTYCLTFLLPDSTHICQELRQCFRGGRSCLQFNHNNRVAPISGENIYSACIRSVFFTVVNDHQSIFKLLDIRS
jgi:hypothetical protein